MFCGVSLVRFNDGESWSEGFYQLYFLGMFWVIFFVSLFVVDLCYFKFW